MLMQNT